MNQRYIQTQLEPRRIPHPLVEKLAGLWVCADGRVDEVATAAAVRVIRQAQVENKLAQVVDSN